MMPAIFVGHGSPTIALEDNEITRKFKEIGDKVIEEHGKPKAILSISAHWFKNENLIQRTEEPKQEYDFFGFPKEMYEIKYPVKGYEKLSDEILNIPDFDAVIDNRWGIDHGTWTPLMHMFPDASIPVVQLSVNATLTPQEAYDIGKKLKFLREKDYLIIGSGNVVHNLMKVDWDNPNGSEATISFNNYITNAITDRNDKKVINYDTHEYAKYAVPTIDHYLPLLYILGASENEKPLVFNNVCNLAAIAMTAYAFGLE